MNDINELTDYKVFTKKDSEELDLHTLSDRALILEKRKAERQKIKAA